MKQIILGLSFFYHDAAAALVVDGTPVAMAQEERFSRKKHDADFPSRAIDFVLAEAGITASDVTAVVFYEKPFLKLERVLKNAIATFPFTPLPFATALRGLLAEKIWIRPLIARQLDIDSQRIYFSSHHLSHAASAFYPSPFEKAAVLTVDGVGEWATVSAGLGEGTQLTFFTEMHFPHSLGLLYSAFTAFLGFEVNEGEYKVMGLAAYGVPRHKDKVEKLFEAYPDGSFGLRLEYFRFHRSTTKMHSQRFIELFGSPRKPGADFDPQRDAYYADIAASVQAVLEDRVVAMAQHLHKLTGLDTLCLAGGVALNSVMNYKLLQRTPFKHIFVQPAAGDAGGALGAALALHHSRGGRRMKPMRHAFYGSSCQNKELAQLLLASEFEHVFIDSQEKLVQAVADKLVAGEVIGWFQGKFEWGPRALGNRSILADPRKKRMQEVVNSKVKFRETFRPFAASVLSGHMKEFFDVGDIGELEPARFMLYVMPVREDRRSQVPAVVHVDGTSRPQLVDSQDCPLYHQLITAFYKKTGIPMLLNTSFNVRGQPLVATPGDALETFKKMQLDCLVAGNYVISKRVLGKR